MAATIKIVSHNSEWQLTYMHCAILKERRSEMCVKNYVKNGSERTGNYCIMDYLHVTHLTFYLPLLPTHRSFRPSFSSSSWRLHSHHPHPVAVNHTSKWKEASFYWLTVNGRLKECFKNYCLAVIYCNEEIFCLNDILNNRKFLIISSFVISLFNFESSLVRWCGRKEQITFFKCQLIVYCLMVIWSRSNKQIMIEFFIKYL